VLHQLPSKPCQSPSHAEQSFARAPALLPRQLCRCHGVAYNAITGSHTKPDGRSDRMDLILIILIILVLFGGGFGYGRYGYGGGFGIGGVLLIVLILYLVLGHR
jgi:hypothetical protein